ncbi:PREDICTED: uncharacterized protein LOC107069540 [Polistes dominula]|uniref:Uncharacterized protein LOC107069540 n=1 Tax=Polistes dominula TaxID=743375 RepID=A0ABM1IRJ7_POLDO|nr:PREDICTED: uncharacterized protein LOC107069540 [Polistes dominula]
MFVKIFVVFLLITIATSKIPSYIHVCGRRNPNFSECARKSILALREKLAEGMPEFNVPSTKTFVLNNISFVNQTDFIVSSKKAMIYGVHAFELPKLDVDLKKKYFHGNFKFETLLIESDCNFYTKIVVPITGRETLKAFAHNVTADVVLKFRYTMKDGKKWIHFDSVNVKMDIKKIDINIKKTAENKNSVLSITINTILGTNKADIIRVVKPNIERDIAKNILTISNNIVSSYPLDEISPDRE